MRQLLPESTAALFGVADTVTGATRDGRGGRGNPQKTAKMQTYGSREGGTGMMLWSSRPRRKWARGCPGLARGGSARQQGPPAPAPRRFVGQSLPRTQEGAVHHGLAPCPEAMCRAPYTGRRCRRCGLAWLGLAALPWGGGVESCRLVTHERKVRPSACFWRKGNRGWGGHRRMAV